MSEMFAIPRGKLEPAAEKAIDELGATAFINFAPQLSIAISLKRIADMMENKK